MRCSVLRVRILTQRPVRLGRKAPIWRTLRTFGCVEHWRGGGFRCTVSTFRFRGRKASTVPKFGPGCRHWPRFDSRDVFLGALLFPGVWRLAGPWAADEASGPNEAAAAAAGVRVAAVRTLLSPV